MGLRCEAESLKAEFEGKALPQAESYEICRSYTTRSSIAGAHL
jgi:hypothetical protein